MKEKYIMTTEQKARAYDEALEKAKKWYNAPNIDKIPTYGNRIIEEIFPELKESEDERIRKALIDYFDDANKSDVTPLQSYGIQTHKVIDWIEKQGEQKPKHRYTFNSIPRLLDMIEPTDKAKSYCQKLIDSLLKEGYAADAKIVSDCLKQMNGEKVAMATMDKHKRADKVEPKFKVGNWVVKNGIVAKILDKQKYGFVGLDVDGNDFFCNYGHTDSMRLWNISDAKDGDVLVASDDSIFLFKGVVDCACKYYVTLTTDNYIKINKDVKGGYWETSRAVYPATKEQCDMLFRKMKEAGYEWDSVNKDLKRITKFKIGDKIHCGDETQPITIVDITNDSYTTDSMIRHIPFSEEDNWTLIKPKFNVGDWIVTEDSFGKIVRHIVEISINIIEQRYVVSDENGLIYDISFSNENKWHKWTIQDAEDGDVLVHNNCTFIFMGIKNGIVNALEENLLCDTNPVCFGEPDKDNDYHPATKEQRDLLFQKIEEAGYKWDAEKKELKKIEPKALDPDKVIEWLDMRLPSGQEKYMIDRFKKDFGL